MPKKKRTAKGRKNAPARTPRQLAAAERRKAEIEEQRAANAYRIAEFARESDWLEGLDDDDELVDFDDEFDDYADDGDDADPEALSDQIRMVQWDLAVIINQTLAKGDATAAPAWVRSVIKTNAFADEEDEGLPPVLSVAVAVLTLWLIRIREEDVDASAALSWIKKHLGAEAHDDATFAAGWIGHSLIPARPLEELEDRFGDRVAAVLVWLVASVIATAGDGDPDWLARLGPPSPAA